MELDINRIANDRINVLLESGELEKLISDGIEKNVKDAITRATSDYSWKRAIEDNLQKVIGEVASKVNFSAYANFLRDRMNEQMERHVKNEMLNVMKDAFEKTYFNVPQNVKLSDILNKYKSYIENNLDNEDRKEWGRIELKIEHNCGFLEIKAGSPNRSSYGRFDNGLEISLLKGDKGSNKSKICYVRSNGNDFRTAMDLNRLSDFEVLIFNLMFTRTDIEIDIEEDYYWDAELEAEDEDY